MHNDTLFKITAYRENIFCIATSAYQLQHILPTLQYFTCPKMLKERLAKHKSVTNFNTQVSPSTFWSHAANYFPLTKITVLEIQNKSTVSTGDLEGPGYNIQLSFKRLWV